MTLIYELHLDIIRILLHTKKMKFLGQGFQKLEPKHDKHTHTHTDATECITTPHLLVVIISEMQSSVKI